MAKYTNHNGKDIKPTKGKNIRISTAGWETIRRYCFDNKIYMGDFLEQSAIAKISAKIKRQK